MRRIVFASLFALCASNAHAQLRAEVIPPSAVSSSRPTSGVLRITNDGNVPLMIGTRCQQRTLIHNDGMVFVLSPDQWKSLRRPPRREIRKAIESLAPGESREISFVIPAFKISAVKIDGEYEVGEQFATEFGVWRGRVRAASALVPTVKSQASDRD